MWADGQTDIPFNCCSICSFATTTQHVQHDTAMQTTLTARVPWTFFGRAPDIAGSAVHKLKHILHDSLADICHHLPSVSLVSMDARFQILLDGALAFLCRTGLPLREVKELEHTHTHTSLCEAERRSWPYVILDSRAASQQVHLAEKAGQVRPCAS